MENLVEEITPKKPIQLEATQLEIESIAKTFKEIELPGYEEDPLFSDQVEESSEIEFTATEQLGEQKHLSFEAITVRLNSEIITRINDIRRKTTRDRRERLAGSHKRSERLTNNSFYRAIMSSVINKLESEDFSDCETEEKLREKVSKLFNEFS